jgi:hypothetical protein
MDEPSPMPRRTLLLAVLLAGVSAGAWAETPMELESICVVVKAPLPTGEFVIAAGPFNTWDWEPMLRVITLTATTQIVAQLDPDLVLPAWELRPGTRVRIAARYWTAERIEVYGLSPYAFTMAVEDWIVEASGNRPDKALSPGQCTTIAALGSPSWLVRDAVSRALCDRGLCELRLLIWARHAADPEVRARAESLLSRLGWERHEGIGRIPKPGP